MARKLRPVTDADLALIRDGIRALHTARACFGVARAPKARAYVSRALKSAEGAERHAIRAQFSEYAEARELEESVDHERVVVVIDAECDECGGSRRSIEGCADCCRDCGFPCKAEKNAEGYHA